MACKEKNLAHDTGRAQRIAQLTALEYAIRQSITVREDQEEAALPAHLASARSHGVRIDDEPTKGDLLSAVQTLVRAVQAAARD